MAVSLISVDGSVSLNGVGAVLAQIEATLGLSAWAIGSFVLGRGGERSKAQMAAGLAGGFSLGIYGRLAYVNEIAHRHPGLWTPYSLRRIDWATVQDSVGGLPFKSLTDVKIHRYEKDGTALMLLSDGSEQPIKEVERMRGGDLMPEAPRDPGRGYRLFDAYSLHRRRPLLTRQAMSTLLAAVAEPLRGPRYKALAHLLGVTDKRLMRWAQGEAPSRTVMLKLIALQAIRSRGERFTGDWTRMPLP